MMGTCDLPLGWTVARLGDLGHFVRGITFPKSAVSKEPAAQLIACLTTKNIQEEITLNNLSYVPLRRTTPGTMS
jgi:hypothetical protein